MRGWTFQGVKIPVGEHSGVWNIWGWNVLGWNRRRGESSGRWIVRGGENIFYKGVNHKRDETSGIRFNEHQIFRLCDVWLGILELEKCEVSSYTFTLFQFQLDRSSQIWDIWCMFYIYIYYIYTLYIYIYIIYILLHCHFSEGHLTKVYRAPDSKKITF